MPLPVRAPFYLEATVRLLQRRPINRVDRLEAPHRYRRLFQLGSGRLWLATVENRGTVSAPDLRLRIDSMGGAAPRAGPTDAARIAARERAAIAAALRRMLGLDLDPADLQRLAALEPRLKPLARALRGMRPPRFPTLFETLANVIPFQQVSLDSGAAMVARIVGRLGASGAARGVSGVSGVSGSGGSDGSSGERYWAFPTAVRVAGEGAAPLRAAGLSKAKATNLHALAARIAAGELDEARLLGLPSESVRDYLLALPGIGPWSAGLVLLRGLGRLDGFPVGDVGVARGLAALLGVSAEGAFDAAAYAERFGALRGLLYFFSLGAQLLTRGLIRPAPGAADDDERAAPAPPRR